MSIQPINTPGNLAQGGTIPAAAAEPAARGASAPVAAAPAAQVAQVAAAAAKTAAPVLPKSEPSAAEVREAARKAQEVLQSKSNSLVFSLDKDSGKTVVKVVDSATDEVIRQFPSEEMLALAKSLEEFQGLKRGDLLKEKA